MNTNTKRLIFAIVVAVIVGVIFMGPKKTAPVSAAVTSPYTMRRNRKSRYENEPKKNGAVAAAPVAAPEGIVGMDVAASDMAYAQVGELPSMPKNIACSINSGVGLASSLLPREVAKTQNFGEFAPENILKGQSFLDPRAMIGFPETVGGNLRNANQSIRAEPPNPKKVYTWQNSTIVPDIMQRKLN